MFRKRLPGKTKKQEKIEKAWQINRFKPERDKSSLFLNKKI